MKLMTLALVAALGGVVFAVSACGGGGGNKVPCVEDMPGMIMCSYRVPIPESPATHAPAALQRRAS